MIVKNFVSSKAIIDDVYRNTAYQHALNYADCTYWIYECLGLLKQPLQFIRKVTGYKDSPNLDITNYRAELPCDFHYLEQIAVNGLPARYSGSTFHHLLSGSCCGLDSATSTDLFIDNFGNAFSPQSSGITNNITNDVVTFDINDNYLTLSVREGKVCMAYLAFPTDAEGYPMIPNDVPYKVALTKYLMMKMSYLDWRKEPSNSGKKALYDHDAKEWEWYAGKSTSDAKMPHPEQMQSIMNQVVRLIPNMQAHNNFFSDLGAQELKKIV